MRRSLYRLWSSSLQKPCWRFWAFLIRARGTSLDTHFHKLRRMRNLWHCLSMQVILCEEHKGGMDRHIIKARICQMHLTWRNASNPWFPCIRHLLQMVCILKPFQYFKFKFSIKVWTYFLQILFILIYVVWNYEGLICGWCNLFHYKTSPNVHSPSCNIGGGCGQSLSINS